MKQIEKAAVFFEAGQEIDGEQLKKELVRMGYRRDYQAMSPGEFAVRGGIIDIFPLTEEQPYRLELWGDEIDSIRMFDPESQRSLEEADVDSFTLYPANEWVLSDEEIQDGLKRIKKEKRTETKMTSVLFYTIFSDGNHPNFLHALRNSSVSAVL